ncbi:MAG: DUF349 domain-containing protein [Actinobacteria bacterium]|jgi:hypothetical protein|uniref:Unannotated protein n=2 Tax=freshwater metagenome TaxID=449393 RepID=A0A6J6NNH8_9ZZZZ|nr:DUF349 domain-containing protein [Actinomycetota bacterium]
MENTTTPNLSNTGAAAALIGDPAKFGRVGEDGTVYVITPTGDRAVGSYPGKTADEALAYFVKKFEMAASEVALLAARIRSGAMVPSDAHEAVNKLRTQILELNGVGDLANLAQSLEKIPALITEHEGAYQARKAAQNAEREARKVEAAAIKEKIVAEAESLIESVAWKVTTARLKELLDDWKKAPRLDKKVDAALWKRFSSSRNKFDKRRRTHFSNLDSEQKKVATTKESIVKEAESLANSREWLNTAKKYKELMDQWKAAGRGKKSADTALWNRFKTAQDTFFKAKNADMDKRKGSMVENLAKREAMIVEFEALLPITDFKSAKKKFYDLMGKWQKIGMTDRKKRASFDSRIKKVEDEINELERNFQRKSDPSAKAQANKVVQGLAEAIENYEKQAAKAEAAGQTAKAMVAREAAAARRGWLEEAQKGLTEFTG